MTSKQLHLFSDLELNPDLIYWIFRHLDYPDIVNLCQTNKQFNSLCKDPYFRRYINYSRRYYDDEKELKSKNKDKSKLYNTKVLINAIREGDVDYVKFLLKVKKIDPSLKNNYAIIDASFNGQFDIVKLLLKDPRVNPSDQNNLAMTEAMGNGYLDIVKLLLKDPRVDPSANNNHVLRLASEYGNLEVVKLLLKDPRVQAHKY